MEPTSTCLGGDAHAARDVDAEDDHCLVLSQSRALRRFSQSHADQHAAAEGAAVVIHASGYLCGLEQVVHGLLAGQLLRLKRDGVAVAAELADPLALLLAAEHTERRSAASAEDLSRVQHTSTDIPITKQKKRKKKK